MSAMSLVGWLLWNFDFGCRPLPFLFVRRLLFHRDHRHIRHTKYAGLRWLCRRRKFRCLLERMFIHLRSRGLHKTRKCVPTLTQTVSFKQKEIWDTTTSVRDGMPQIQNREHFTGKLDSATFWLALQDEALVTVPHSKCLRLYVQPRHCLVSYPSFLTLVVLASPLQSSTTSRPIDQGRKR